MRIEGSVIKVSDKKLKCEKRKLSFAFFTLFKYLKCKM